MQKILIILIFSINAFCYDFGEDVNIMGKWEITTENNQFVNFMTSPGNRWKVEIKDDGFIYDLEDGKFIHEKWSYTREKGVINIEFYNQNNSGEKMFNGRFKNLTNNDIKIIKKIEFNKYLVEIIGTNDKLIMQRLGDSKQIKNTKLKKDIKIEMK